MGKARLYMKILFVILCMFLGASSMHGMLEEDDADLFLQQAKKDLLESIHIEFIATGQALNRLCNSIEALKLTSDAIELPNGSHVNPHIYLQHAVVLKKASKVVERIVNDAQIAQNTKEEAKKTS